MHPEIRAFWEKIGEVDLTPSAPTRWYVVQRYSDNAYISIAEITFPDKKCNITEKTSKYFYNDVEYTEEEMLRIIRNLKAFL